VSPQQLLPFRWRRVNSLLHCVPLSWRVSTVSEFRKIHKNYDDHGVIVHDAINGETIRFLASDRSARSKNVNTRAIRVLSALSCACACAREIREIAFYEPRQSRDCTEQSHGEIRYCNFAGGRALSLFHSRARASCSRASSPDVISPHAGTREIFNVHLAPLR